MFDYKKNDKAFYLPKNKPEIIDIPSMRFAMIEGEGDPNGDAFSKVTEALYAFSYAVKMSYKGEHKPDGYYEYTVFPFEGIWDLVDPSRGISDKSNFKYELMIRQPDFVNEDVFSFFLELAKKKKPNMYLDRVRFVEIKDGLSCQMLHLGSYDDEPASFEQMEKYCKSNGYTRLSKVHREIYLSDPRKTASEKLKTVLRFNVSQNL